MTLLMTSGESTISAIIFFYLILYVISTIFQLYRDGSSWVEPVLSLDICGLLKDHNAVTLMRLEPGALRSWVKHSTTEPLRSLCAINVIMVNVLIFRQLFFFFSLIKFWFSGLEFTKWFSRIANREDPDMSLPCRLFVYAFLAGP